jgi:uracil-DNA glycosylase
VSDGVQGRSASEPNWNCARCDRLVVFRRDNQTAEPGWFNGAVPSFGVSDCRLLIVGLASVPFQTFATA